MRKLRKINVGNLTMLNQQEMMSLTGGEQKFTCRTNETCNLYVAELGFTIQGKCHYSSNGTTVSCYCKNGKYSTTPGHGSSCWKS